MGSIRGPTGVNLGLVWGRFGGQLRSICGGFGCDLAPTWGLARVGSGSTSIRAAGALRADLLAVHHRPHPHGPLPAPLLPRRLLPLLEGGRRGRRGRRPGRRARAGEAGRGGGLGAGVAPRRCAPPPLHVVLGDRAGPKVGAGSWLNLGADIGMESAQSVSKSAKFAPETKVFDGLRRSRDRFGSVWPNSTKIGIGTDSFGMSGGQLWGSCSEVCRKNLPKNGLKSDRGSPKVRRNRLTLLGVG